MSNRKEDIDLSEQSIKKDKRTSDAEKNTLSSNSDVWPPMPVVGDTPEIDRINISGGDRNIALNVATASAGVLLGIIAGLGVSIFVCCVILRLLPCTANFMFYLTPVPVYIFVARNIALKIKPFAYAFGFTCVAIALTATFFGWVTRGSPCASFP